MHLMKPNMSSVLLAIAVPVCLAIFWLVSTSRAATETPEYKVIRTDEKFEIRELVLCHSFIDG